MKAKLLTVALLAAGAAGLAMPVTLPARPASVAAGASVAASADPGRQIEELARLFRRNDVAGMVKALVPPSKWEQVQLAYVAHQFEPTREKDRADFAEGWTKFTAPDAVDRIMAEIEPKLEEARPQLPSALLMAYGAMGMAVTSPESKLDETQRASLKAAIPGIQAWASSTDFLSSETMREALTLVTTAVRGTGIKDLDQLKAMPLETVLERAGPVLAAAKRAVGLYGIDVDAIVDTLDVEVLEVAGDSARVKLTVTVFDAPVSGVQELSLVEGRWFGKHAHIHMGERGHHADHEHEEAVESDADEG